MAPFGSVSLIVALVAVLVSIVCCILATHQAKKLISASKREAAQITAGFSGPTNVQMLAFVGVWLSTLALTVCCAILLIGFLGDDNTINYVVRQRSDSSSDLAILYKISGLWAGRQGSLLFWAWLISVFNAIVALKAWRDINRSTKAPIDALSATPQPEKKASSKDTTVRTALDTAALAISQLVLLAFVAILVFDEGNNPFIPLAAEYLDADGHVIGNAALWGMNALLEHWAMAIHPPTLFIGYAGLTIPFAYAVGALIVNDPSRNWVDRASRYTLFSWLFLGAGIGLGAVWAYVVLGWGGYWGWDPVENASLLPWLVGVALIHSMTIYKQRDAFKRWTVMCACLTFSLAIVGTFITRSGIVESVHAFDANQVSLILFGILIIVPLVAGIIGLIIRRNSFAGDTTEGDEAESLMSKDVAYYLNNVVLVVCTLFLLYMTLSQALPAGLPFAGQSLGASAYNAIARPVGILYCLIIAVCPLLAWGKTKGKSFLKQAWLPALFALALFAVLLVYFFTTLMPSYMQTMAAGGSNAETLLEAGPFWYYATLTIAGFLAASLLIFNSLIILVRAIAKRNIRAQSIGGFVAHMAMGIMVIGLIGSSMYVTQNSGYMAYDEDTDTAAESFVVDDYTLTYVENTVEETDNGDDMIFTVTFEVERDGEYLGEVSPSVLLVQSTNQQQLNAAVMSFPTEDLFVVYKGVNNEGAYSLDVRVNPLISLVWIGFGLLMVGSAIASFGRRR